MGKFVAPQRQLRVSPRPITAAARMTGSCHHAKNSTLYVLRSLRGALELRTPKTNAWVQAIPTPCQAQPMSSHGVLPLTSIGVLLSATRTARGFRISTTGVSTTSTRAAPTTCVQCGLFDLFFYFSILIFLPSGRKIFFEI